MRLVRFILIVIAVAASAACLWAWRDMVKREGGSVLTRRLTQEEEALVGSYTTVGGIDSSACIVLHSDRTTEHRMVGMAWPGVRYSGHWYLSDNDLIFTPPTAPHGFLSGGCQVHRENGWISLINTLVPEERFYKEGKSRGPKAQ